MCPQVCNPWLLSRTSPPLLSEDGTARLDTVVGGWRAGVSAGGRLGGPAHECNPRYRLSAGSLTQSANCELVDVVITFYQPDQRGVGGGNGGWADRYLYLHNSDSNAVEQEGVTDQLSKALVRFPLTQLSKKGSSRHHCSSDASPI